ncbi:amino acid adenylation domain-containing protein [Actinacidiphila yanglinensis]|uniref:Amino acid adenylation domain-containing protein n=1 Tax=Actinacidiphila yanglinensis TaxID=310779 RepID=A0A1H6E920_9ACTN|nr:non-ribosomal peptide synthetase [Actinacidiphila yanglinensis]SEG94207.1 amino acid adenylation domain-containing protein [Actinacidiphila yanglinensis]
MTAPTEPHAATLTGLFEESVRRHADRLAVADAQRSLTYAELGALADDVAALLVARGITREDRVGLHMNRSVYVFAAILGILKAGAAYVAVDSRYPDARRDLMLTQSGVKVVLTDPAWKRGLDAHGAVTIPYGPGALPAAAPVPQDRSRPEGAASVLFTSGSLGTPKGIVLEHRNIVWFARNRSLPALTPDDRVGQVSSLSFDAFHFEMWHALRQGAAVVVLPTVPELLAAGFQEELRRLRITAMLVPTMVANHVVREDPDAFCALRLLHVGGDVVLPATCRAILSGRFRGRLLNLYGPAEITTTCTAHEVTLTDTEHDGVPIGTPLDGVGIRLLDADGRQPAPGQVGEIHVSGPGVARGYLDRPDLTEERFRTDMPGAGPGRWYRTGDLARYRDDGALEFLGRADDQVKIRGYRVERGEVERTLLGHPGVHHAAVLPEGEGEDRSLAALVVLDHDVPPEALRAHCARLLPEFMVPSRFVPLAQMPANEHGKRDLDALRQILADARGHAAPGEVGPSPTEAYLVRLWQDLLGVVQVGVQDQFFELGGHSLLAFRMQGRIKRDLKVVLPSAVLLRTPVLSTIAASIDELRQAGAADD